MKRILILLLVLAATPIMVHGQADESCSRTSGLCWPRLKAGVRGEKVRTLQILLQSRGLAVAPDGVFGASTERVVRSFQKRKHLKIDGVVGFQTWSEVVPYLARGARGESVQRLQVLLSQFDGGKHQVKADGFYGVQTQEAVRKINVMMSFDEIKGNGETDEAVWCALLGGHYDGE